MVTLVRANWSTPSPLTLPLALASTTVPWAADPAGIAVLPSTATGLATVAEKLSPVELVFDPSACATRTVMTVPAGITRGLGGAGTGFGAGATAAAGGGRLAEAEASASAGALAEDAEDEVEVCWSVAC